MPETGKLVLFDVDRTLVIGSPVHRNSFSRALKRVYGVDTDIDVIDHDGLSDQKIIMEVLRVCGLPEGRIRAGLGKCMKMMADYYRVHSHEFRVTALAGVNKLLEEMRRRGFVIGLVTGNLEPIAKAKMRDAGLERYFSVGAFGSDGSDRAGLIRLAISRVQEQTGLSFKNNAFVFGDTPRDIEAGRKAGVVSVGVATGRYSADALKRAGANHVLADLRDSKNVLGILS